MRELSHWLKSAGTIVKRSIDIKPGRGRTPGKQSARRTRLLLEDLEDRVVPTMLGQQLFPLDYPMNQNIASAPVAANSAAVIAHLGSATVHPDWGEDSPSNGATPLYGIPLNIVHGNTTPKVNVIIDNYPGESDMLPVPIPANAVIEGDFQNGPNLNVSERGDSHLIIWDEDNNIAYELYGVSRPADPLLFANTAGVELAHSDNQWHAAQETVWNMNTDQFRSLGETSADAAGLSILAGLARPDEGLPVSQGGQGAIDHALRFTLPSGDILSQYVYPASHMVNASAGTNKLPLGARLRLNNSPAVDALIAKMGPEAQIIATAMQQYGLVLADIGSTMYIGGASASVDSSNNIDLTWNMNDVLGLKALNASDFSVVNLTPAVTGLSMSSGPAGSTVTIIGQNFSGAAGNLHVLFGGVPATSVQYVDDSHIKAIVPGGSGMVNVQVQSGVNETDPNNPKDDVTNPIFGYGISADSTADQFTYANNSQTLVISALPSTATAGGSESFSVTVENSQGLPQTGYTGTVHFSSSDPKAVLPANYTFSASDAGVHVFSAKLETAGQQTFTVQDVANASLTVTSPQITISPAAVAQLGVNSPVGTAAGISFNVTVTAQDAFGNAVPSYLGTVRFSSTDHLAALPANYTFTSADRGIHTFSAALKTAGTESLVAADKNLGSVLGIDSGVEVSPGKASQFKLTFSKTSTTAGGAFSVTIAAEDPYGNVASSYTGTVAFTSTDGQATLPSTYTFTSSDSGVHVFLHQVTLRTAGPATITATDTSHSALTSTGTVTVMAGVAVKLTLTSVTSVSAGSAFTITVTAFDPFGNISTSYTGIVSFMSSDSRAVLPANYQFVSANQGVYSFTVILNSSGTQSITASDNSKPAITGSDTGIKVVAGPSHANQMTGAAVEVDETSYSEAALLSVVDEEEQPAEMGGPGEVVRFVSSSDRTATALIFAREEQPLEHQAGTQSEIAALAAAVLGYGLIARPGNKFDTRAKQDLQFRLRA